MVNGSRPSRRALRAWVRAARGRQVALAAACGITQQYVSSLAAPFGPVPSAHVAELIDAATGGAVPASGWETERERERRAAALDRARSAGLA